ncbi:hypothetical protein PS6_005114 [Mucor atramentarius]
MNNELYYPNSSLPRQYWKRIIRKNVEDRRVQLRRKFEGNSTPEDIKDRQRRKSVKTDCPFIFKLTYSKKAPEDSEQECSKNENAHNHSLTLEEFQHLSKAKKLLVGLKIIDVIQKMISAGNSVPQIRKAIDGTDGKSILTYDDIRSWKVEVESHDKSMDKIRNSASVLIRRTESRDHSGRYQASSDGKDVKSIFFIHSNAAAEIYVHWGSFWYLCDIQGQQ